MTTQTLPKPPATQPDPPASRHTVVVLGDGILAYFRPQPQLRLIHGDGIDFPVAVMPEQIEPTP